MISDDPLCDTIRLRGSDSHKIIPKQFSPSRLFVLAIRSKSDDLAQLFSKCTLHGASVLRDAFTKASRCRPLLSVAASLSVSMFSYLFLSSRKMVVKNYEIALPVEKV
jgi:hypothetical protein